MHKFLLCLVSVVFVSVFGVAQESVVRFGGTVKDEGGKILAGVTVSLLNGKDSSLIKAELTDESGKFLVERKAAVASYLLSFSLVGHALQYSNTFSSSAPISDLGIIVLKAEAASLQTVTVTAKRPIMEVRADKTVFNVENSINATGSNALELLQKSPGIQVDNNENISMKGKTGVRIYVDGKMTQLSQQDLAAYLKSINSNDVEAIEMIANPGARYDASGNAGIINIRLKKNKKYGTNGTFTAGFIQGVTAKGNASLGLNHRNNKWNLFSNVGVSQGRNQNTLDLYRIQRDTLYDQFSTNWNYAKSLNAKMGADYFIDRRQTLGMMITSNFSDNDLFSVSNTSISYHPTKQYVKQLQALNSIPGSRTNMNANLNYRFTDTTGREVNADLDYGLFRGTGRSFQPNNYIDRSGNLLARIVNRNYTPTSIDIYTAKVDVEQPKWKGKLGYGAKFAYVATINTFDFFQDINNAPVKILSRSNRFDYSENVNAGYVNYQRVINEKWSMQGGVRLEQTNSKGILTRMDGVMQADNTVKRSYLNAFPSAAFSWNVSKINTLNLTFSRRIDRPTYQDLNPFENKLDELTYEKGNAFLRPQYTNTVELQHTWKQLITTTLGYSHVNDFATVTTDTIFNASYIQQKNLERQRIWSVSVGSPLPIAKWWSGYANVYFNYQSFNGMIGGKELRMKLPIYGAYMQHALTLGKGYAAEVSGWYSGPNVWGGTWKTSSQGGLDLGVQKQLWEKKGTVKLSVTDIFFTNPWTAVSDFGGLFINGGGNWESRTVRVSFSWRFGRSEANARQRQTGLESESKRIKG